MRASDDALFALDQVLETVQQDSPFAHATRREASIYTDLAGELSKLAFNNLRC